MNYTAAVITVSDKGFRGERVDTSGPAICAIAESYGLSVVYHTIVPDEAEDIRRELVQCADERGISLILTTGGTGFSPRDCMPEATADVTERAVPGIPEAMRYLSLQITPRAMLSRASAGIRKGTLIVNLPGSPKAVKECLEFILPALEHGLEILRGTANNCARQ